ncbi:MAG: hypothetical protein EOO77_36400 [Oxalobacteraceae bacterium]|jgi:hypothetical protein|nr:MAG: hypothetical protein EOO77_36400 [Oxalobacteraceae bacterium]
MNKSTRETLYPSTRLSAKIVQRGVGVNNDAAVSPDRALIEALRSAREEGYDAMSADQVTARLVP